MQQQNDWKYNASKNWGGKHDRKPPPKGCVSSVQNQRLEMTEESRREKTELAMVATFGLLRERLESGISKSLP